MSLFGCIECENQQRNHDIKITYAVGLGPCLPWEFRIFSDWHGKEGFAEWLKQENEKHGPVVIIAWEYVPCR